ncbi:tRNA pseudouridine(55) synthase TruB [Actinomycetospora corticicola]|uniref:tRNA pseudouridine synthase B n=1 Tax=Actinomycetospora corticicola TaxID=663602 RepID=A0A7Y9J5V8_9PSEU|nr:tRNA pseudouridine(55) synthase TruB [Actinomycetospora corticicola]NYD36411.1 tRNA pseudouridine55 synthase [Actinomycetospora corticicola]
MNARAPQRRSNPPPPPGLLVVDKPGGWTSHDVVGKARRLVGTRKVGHAGTLDPMATGVLVLGVERATKLLGHLALDTKTYLATIRLGAATTTDDAEGEVVSTADASAIADDAVDTEVAALTGDLSQVPSTVSAIKVDGRRAYERVRAGEEVTLPARPVHVGRFDVLARRREGEGLELDVLVDCSSGTYVRALARDLGAGLGVGGHLTALRRTRVGPFTLAHARTVDELVAEADGEAGRAGLSLDLDAATGTAFPRRDVDAAQAADLAHGRPLPPSGGPGTTAVFGPDGHVVGLVADTEGRARPVLVLAPAG